MPLKGGLFTLLFVAFSVFSSASVQAAINKAAIDLAIVSSNTDLTQLMNGYEETVVEFSTPTDALLKAHWKPVSTHPQMLEAPRQHSVLWLETTLTNSSSDAVSRWLNFSPWRLESVYAWLLDPKTQITTKRLIAGTQTSLSERSVDSTRALIPVSLDPGETRQIIIRIESQSRPFLEVASWDPIDFSVTEAQRYQFHSVQLAIVLTLVVVLILKVDLKYLLLAAWMLSLFLFEAEKEGYFSHILFPGLANYADNLRFSTWILTEALFLIASIHLLGLNREKLWRHIPLTALCVSGTFAALSFIIDGALIRHIGSAIDLTFSMVWLFLIPSALAKKRDLQLVTTFLLAAWWATSTFILLGYIFNFYYTAAFATPKVVVEVGVIFGLILVYSQQKQMHEHKIRAMLHQKEQEERKLLEAAVASRTRELEVALMATHKAVEAKSEFLSRVTHDLKSPLTSILGFSQLLRVEPGKTGKMSGAIYSSAAHMLDLITRLIDYARDSSNEEAIISDVYLHAFVDNLAHEARVLAARNGNTFYLNVSESLCPVIRCDQTFLRETLLNLLENATKYTVSGEVRLSVSCSPADEPGRLHIEWVIEDTGPGIPAEKQDKLFEPLYRASNQGEGSGLGLAIVKELVRKLNGTIRLESESGRGTKVTVTMITEPGSEVADAAFQKIPNYMLPKLDARGLKAWVIEDVKSIRELLKEELISVGFGVTTFENGEQAIAYMQSDTQAPAMIITDHLMPGANGDSVLAVAKEVFTGTPVILLSATWGPYADESEKSRNGFFACLTKPIDLAILRRSIARACGLTLENEIPSGHPDQGHRIEGGEDKSLSSKQLSELAGMVELGAVSDLMDWCDGLSQRAELKGLARQIRGLAERGDFKTIEKLFL